jgi:hypothetical protein
MRVGQYALGIVRQRNLYSRVNLLLSLYMRLYIAAQCFSQSACLLYEALEQCLVFAQQPQQKVLWINRLRAEL